MVIWSGWGILTVLITALVYGTVSAAGAALPGTTGQQGWTDLAFGLGLLAAAAVNWWVGRRLNGGPGRVLTDQATGQTVILRRRHSLFFIPMQWWSVPLAIAGVLVMLDTAVLPPNPTTPPRGTVRL